MSDTVEGRQIKAAIKQLIKKGGHTYADLAKALGVSLPTVRRYLSKDDLSVDTLVAIADWLGLSFVELVKMAEQQRHLPTFLTLAQEEYFAAFPHFYTYLRFLGGGMSPAEIETKFHLTPKTTERYLVELEQLELVSRADGRVRLRVAWPAHWNFPGPLQKKYAPAIYRTAVDRLTAKSAAPEHKPDYGKEFFFMMDSLLLRESTYGEYVKEIVALYQKYNTIGRHESRVAERKELRLCSSLLGIDQIDPLTETMGTVKNLS